MAEKAEERTRPIGDRIDSRPDEPEMRQERRERQDAEDRAPDDGFRAQAVGQRPPRNVPGRDCGEKDEKHHLRRLQRHAESRPSDRRCSSCRGSTGRAPSRTGARSAPRSSGRPIARACRGPARPGPVCAAARCAACQRLTQVRSTTAISGEHGEGERPKCCPNGTTTKAASSGPVDWPKLPPTWKRLWAKPCRPPEAARATREASGWKTALPIRSPRRTRADSG